MVDSFTASVMLSAVANGQTKEEVGQVYDLYKEMNSKSDGGPSPQARAFFEKNQGKKCKVKFTSHEGIVHRLNESTSGFYPGGRFPIYVKITNGEAAGQVFEYDLDQVEVTE
jgi:hypothetical protein